MCLVFVAHEQHPRYRLVVAANRDEFYARPTAPAACWDDAPDIIAGRDLEAGGTWLGVARSGRFAALTNHRDADVRRADARSRGLIVSEFLASAERPRVWLERLAGEADRYNGFGLIAGDGDSLFYYSNRDGTLRELGAGLYGLSNHLLDTPWPKVERGKEAIARVLAAHAPSPERLFAIMADRRPAIAGSAQSALERRLSSPFVQAESYGTRSTTVVLVARDGETLLAERSYEAHGARHTTVSHRLVPGAGVES